MEIYKDRIKFEVDRMIESGFGRIGGLGFCYEKEKNIMDVSMNSNWSSGFTKKIMDDEITEIKRILVELRKASVLLDEFLKDREIRYELLDGSAMGGVELAFEFNEKTEYIVEIEK